MGITDNQVYVKQAMAVHLGLLMAQGAASAENKVLSQVVKYWRNCRPYISKNTIATLLLCFFVTNTWAQGPKSLGVDPSEQQHIEFPPIEDDIQALAKYGGKAQYAGQRLIEQGIEVLPQSHIALQNPKVTFPQKMQLITVLGEIADPSSIEVIIDVAAASTNRYLYQNTLLSLAKFEPTDDIINFVNQQLEDGKREPLILRTALAYYAQQPHADAEKWVDYYTQPTANEDVRFAALYLGGVLGLDRVKDDIVGLLNAGVSSPARQYYLLMGLVEITDINEFNQLTKDLQFYGRNKGKIEPYLQFRKGDATQRESLAKMLLSEGDITQKRQAVDYLINEKNANALANHWKFKDSYVRAAVRRAGYEIEFREDGARFVTVQPPSPDFIAQNEESRDPETIGSNNLPEPDKYELAMAIKNAPGFRFRSKSDYWKLLEQAAQKGHPEAIRAIIASPRSSEEKARWLKIAAVQGDAWAQYEFYLLIRKSESSEYGDPLKWLTAAADGGLSEAQFQLGSLLAGGETRLGITQAPDKARARWEQAASNGHGKAMKQLAKHYAMGKPGFPYNLERHIELKKMIAKGYQEGRYGFQADPDMASIILEEIKVVEEMMQHIAAGDTQTLIAYGQKLIKRGSSPSMRKQGLDHLTRAAQNGSAQAQYELGFIYLFGRHGIGKDFAKGRHWWNLAVQQQHIKALEQVAMAYQNGRFDYPVDLLKSKVFIEQLITIYSKGTSAIKPDKAMAQQWKNELQDIHHRFEIAGGDYQPLNELALEADKGSSAAQYQLGKQLLAAGPVAEQVKGIKRIEQAAENGHVAAQYQLANHYLHDSHLIPNDQVRGVALLQSAASQRHLRAMGKLALALEKGRYGLTTDRRQAIRWYQQLLDYFESGDYLGEVDERFVKNQRRFLGTARKIQKSLDEKAAHYAAASPLERQILDIKERYRLAYKKEASKLDYSDLTPQGRAAIQKIAKEIRLRYARQRDDEIAELKAAAR